MSQIFVDKKIKNKIKYCVGINWICHLVSCFSQPMLRHIALNMKYSLLITHKLVILNGTGLVLEKKIR